MKKTSNTTAGLILTVCFNFTGFAGAYHAVNCYKVRSRLLKDCTETTPAQVAMVESKVVEENRSRGHSQHT